MDAPSLADFLRRRRAALQPDAVGLPAGRRRRTPGLRREEVAALTGMSCDYYTRLEQARGPRPSRQLLAALARALRLTDDERDHLFHLVGEEAPRLGMTSDHVRPGVLRMLDRLRDLPASVFDDLGYILAWTPVAAALGSDYSELADADRNVHLLFFCPPSGRPRLAVRDREANARSHVADLRLAVAAHPGDRRGPELVRRLRAGSPEFARLWEEHEVTVRRSMTKTFVHPEIGEIELACEMFHLPEAGQKLIVHSAAPGSSAEQALELLRVLGTQTTAV
ncbi:MmyB family transcriptional regulator [Fodinicola feengrottensis]|uniref:Helix-turn-helix transcriptional regulator n=1 Tax=Fodinicola feengrottensis TaxID=435914 RepID=A0ABN2HG75_9ACTN|nr:helix-turn-helix transcriptional regulator [Fodinicola feengrottensis]